MSDASPEERLILVPEWAVWSIARYLRKNFHDMDEEEAALNAALDKAERDSVTEQEQPA